MRQSGREMLDRAIGRNAASYQRGSAQPGSQAGGRNVLRADAIALIGLAAVRTVVAIVASKPVHWRRSHVWIGHAVMGHIAAHIRMARRRLMRGHAMVGHAVICQTASNRRARHMHLRRRIRIARSIEDQDNAEQHAQKEGGKR